MNACCVQEGLNLDRDEFRQSFDREPFEFTHNLSQLDLFEPDAILALAHHSGGLFRLVGLRGMAAYLAG